MQSIVSEVEEYINTLPEDRKQPMKQLRHAIVKNLPQGFKEQMASGMISYVVPHSIYPDGYHCNSNQPLLLMGFASKKNFVVFHHMGIYASQDLMNWFKSEYAKERNNKPDMGKSVYDLSK